MHDEIEQTQFHQYHEVPREVYWETLPLILKLGFEVQWYENVR